MADKRQVLEIMARLKESNPLEIFKIIDEINSGMGYILLRLYNAKSEVYAIHLSKDMQISRARVTMLLRKLINKGFVLKQQSKSDARKEIVTITNKGREEVTILKQKIFSNVSKLVDKLGTEKINQFIDLSNEIHKIMHK